jgi:hypothetical protein
MGRTRLSYRQKMELEGFLHAVFALKNLVSTASWPLLMQAEEKPAIVGSC